MCPSGIYIKDLLKRKDPCLNTRHRAAEHSCDAVWVSITVWCVGLTCTSHLFEKGIGQTNSKQMILANKGTLHCERWSIPTPTNVRLPLLAALYQHCSRAMDKRNPHPAICPYFRLGLTEETFHNSRNALWVGQITGCLCCVVTCTMMVKTILRSSA